MTVARADSDVIVALATPWGSSALAVVRLSGHGAHEVAARVAFPMRATPLVPGPPRRVTLRDARGAFDDGMLWLARAPHTATGEDTAELTLHGNPRIIERAIEALIAAGAHMAEPGAFTRRALEHGRIDLVGAEAIEATIAATTDIGLHAAHHARVGQTSAQIAQLRNTVIEALAELEARIDVPGDETAHLDDDALRERLRDVARTARAWICTARAGHHLVHGARIALVGEVNVGKSSLLNALLGRVRALVADVPGTTRDVLEVPCAIGPLATTLLDTAGERETTDAIEAAGQALARDLIEDADLILLVVHAKPGPLSTLSQLLQERLRDQRVLVIANGLDRPGAALPDGVPLGISALSGEGLDALREAILARLIGTLPTSSLPVVFSLRQAGELHALAEGIDAALVGWDEAGCAVAASFLHDGLEAIDALTGADRREDVLDALFARFCVGK